MRTYMIGFASVLAVVLGFGVPASAQGDKPTQDKAAPTPGSANVAAMIPLRVQVVISRMQGDKKILSVPYTLSVSAQDKNDRPQSEMSRLRMGARVPVPLPISNGQTVPFNYQDLGTNIDCHATIADAGRFKLDVTIEDSSLYTADELGQLVKGTNATVFRQFRVSNSAILRDGQTTQFTTATDRISGETVRVDVSLSVLK